jgi:hypothetical protein
MKFIIFLFLLLVLGCPVDFGGKSNNTCDSGNSTNNSRFFIENKVIIKEVHTSTAGT